MTPSVLLQVHRVPETLFNPLKAELRGIDSLVSDAIACVSNELRMIMYHNIVLAGGNTFFAHIAERLQEELIPRAPAPMLRWACHVL